MLDEAGTIWKRMLAHMMLSRAERQQFYALPAQGPRREEWLMGRLRPPRRPIRHAARRSTPRIARAATAPRAMATARQRLEWLRRRSPKSEERRVGNECVRPCRSR